MGEQYSLEFEGRKKRRLERGLIYTPPKSSGVDVPVTQLQSGDWSIGHGALVAHSEIVDHGRKVEITFFENRPKPVKVDRDETLAVIRQKH